MQDIVIDRSDRVPFEINDVKLLIDPIQISIYKEGLNYSWKTLRTKASSKIVNGNSVFHLKLNLIFTKSMFLEMHRLVCQIRNTPYVQITNDLVSESVSSKQGNASVFFTVNSLQLIPRADSPFTVDMELDLRYFNHKPYGELKYKRQFETLPHLKTKQPHIYTFDVFDDVRVEIPIEEKTPATKLTRRKIVDTNTLLKRSIRKYNTTAGAIKASDSNAYKRYSNYLQIKNLKESFGFDIEFLKELLKSENVNARKVISLCEMSSSAKEGIYNDQKVYGLDDSGQGSSGYINTLFTYQSYYSLKLDKEENKALRQHFEGKVKDIKDYSKRRKKIQELKAKFMEKLKAGNLKDTFPTFYAQIESLKNKNINYYTERSSVNNIIFLNNQINVTQDQVEGSGLTSQACITNFSCGFTNMFSTIPIVGQEYPTHQYLGASEPVYNVNILLPSLKGGTSGPDRGLGDVGNLFESMRFMLQKNAKDFKRIPDAGYFGVENFFTKLLGSKKREVDAGSLKQRNNFILRNFNVSTVEGAPGSKTLQFSFCETNDFVEEELGRVYTKGGSNDYLSRVNDELTKTSPTQRPKPNTKSTDYKVKNWKTKYFSSDPTSPNDFYFSWVQRGRDLNKITEEQDKKAFEFCRDYLDPIQEALKGRKVNIGSSVDRPYTLTRKGASRHYSGAAVDISVAGMSPGALAKTVSEVLTNAVGQFGVIAYYPNMGDFNDGKKMTGFLQKSFFVHVDDRTVVDREYKVDAEGKKTYKDDVITITPRNAGTYHGLDIDNTLKGKPAVTNVEDFYVDDYDPDNGESPADVALEEVDVDVESILNSTDIRQRLKSRINPFGAQMEEQYSDVEVKKFKDLEETEQQIVRSIRPNSTSVNPELGVSIIEEANDKRRTELISSLKKQGINYTLDNSNKIFIPRSSSNRAIVTKNKQMNAYLTMLDNFYKLASLMLTEPVLYADDAEAEKANIRKVLKDEKVTPILFNSFEKFFEKISHSLETDMISGMLAAETVAMLSLVFKTSSTGAVTAVNPFRKLGSAIAATATGSMLWVSGQTALEEVAGFGRYAECMNHIKRIAGKRGIAKEYTEFQNLVPDSFQIKPDDSFQSFYQNVSSSDQVALNFGLVSYYLMYESNLIKDFSTSATNIVPKSKVALALGTYSNIKKTVDDKGYQLKGALSETLFMGELKRYHQYIFEFPYIRGTLDEEDFYDLYELKEGRGVVFGDLKRKFDETDYIPYETKGKSAAHEYLYSVNQIADGDIGNIDIPFTKAELKQRQESKLEYLKNLKESILEELGEFPEIQEILGVNREVSIFELAEENAYPDITLPIDPSNPSNNVNLHPAFYFHDPVEESRTRWDYIRPELESNINYIIEKAHAFYEALESGIYSGSERDFIKSKKGLELKIANYATYEKVLRDANDEVPKLPNGNTRPTGPISKGGEVAITAAASTPLNGEFKQTKGLFDDRKKKFEALNSSFENMFGEVGKKAITNKPSSFTTEEKIKKEAIDSCKGLLKVKKSIKKAFPTYRLYLIEEDSIESDKLSVYDDFYNYNGVKGFTVYSNKKLPTSTAVIQLQNISGVLDGTKPEVVRDIDIDQNLTPEEEAQQQASVSSVVMRPGINIQLRAGYESNPTKLDIIFTGRVTEVKNSSAGEMIEIVAQSFGTELIARKYGLQNNSPIREKTFYNTHSLLGTLMLSEELRHFGRVKKGRLFQRGENKQISLDLDTGKIDDWVNFSVLGWTQRFFEDYGVYIFLATSLAQGTGSLIKRGAAMGGKWFGKASTQLDNIINATLVQKGSTAVRAYASNLAAIRFMRNKALTGWLVRASGGLAGLTGQLMKGIFITIPAKLRTGLTNLSLAKFLGGPQIGLIRDASLRRADLFGEVSINSTAFWGLTRTTLARIANIIPTLFKREGFFRGKNLLLTTEQFNNMVVGKYGYYFANAQGLLRTGTTGLGAGISLTRSFTGSAQTVFGGGTILRNFATNYITALYVSAAIDLVAGALSLLGDGFSNLWGEKLNPPTTKIFLEPQDDNIYPPKPSKYLVHTGGWDDFLKKLEEAGWRSFETLVNGSFGILGYTNSFSSDAQATIIKNAYLKSDNRLSTSKHENDYIVAGSTIWEVLHEMSLRHPGYLYGIRKYGDGLESRVFFGMSNQRCFVKDLPAREIQLLNKIEAAVKRMPSNSNTFTEDTVKQLLNIKEIKQDELPEKTNQLLDYWISKTSERFVPFRKYHSVDSEHDIIANNLRVQNNKVVNQVAVTFQNKDKEESIYAVKALRHLSEDRINEKGINYKNCRGYSAACRYGMGELIHSAKEMYGGEILVVGNPKIDTNDICILTDDYSNMHGLFEVEAVTHMFSYETGFVTELVPNAVVFGNENYLGSISSSSIAFDAHRKMLDTYTNRNQLFTEGKVDDAKLEEIAEAALIQVFSDSESGFVNALYGGLSFLPFGLTDYSNLESEDKRKLIESIKKSLRASIKEGAIFLEDITGDINTTVLNAPINNSSLVAGIVTGLTTGLLTLSPAKGLIAAGSVGVGSNLAVRGAADSVKSGYLGKNIFRDLLVSQIEEGHIVKLLPIVKDGAPLVTGGYEYLKQHQRFKDAFGNFFNPLSDAMQGFATRVKELEEDYKMMGVNSYRNNETFSVGLRRVPVFMAGQAAEFMSAGAIPAEAVYMKLEEEQ